MEKDQEAERVHWRYTKDLQVGWSCAWRQKFCYGKSKFSSLSRRGKILLFFLLLPAVLSLPLPWASSGICWINLLNRQKPTWGIKKEFAFWRDLNQPSKGSVWGRGGEKWGGCTLSLCELKVDKPQESIPRVSGWVKSREHPSSLSSDQRCKELVKNVKIACSQYPVCWMLEKKVRTEVHPRFLWYALLASSYLWLKGFLS